MCHSFSFLSLFFFLITLLICLNGHATTAQLSCGQADSLQASELTSFPAFWHKPPRLKSQYKSSDFSIYFGKFCPGNPSRCIHISPADSQKYIGKEEREMVQTTSRNQTEYYCSVTIILKLYHILDFKNKIPSLMRFWSFLCADTAALLCI